MRNFFTFLTIGLVLWISAKGDALKVGFDHVGPKGDYGYNQAHPEGAKALAARPGVSPCWSSTPRTAISRSSSEPRSR